VNGYSVYLTPMILFGGGMWHENEGFAVLLAESNETKSK
jgi:hypothetical protein